MGSQQNVQITEMKINVLKTHFLVHKVLCFLENNDMKWKMLIKCSHFLKETVNNN